MRRLMTLLLALSSFACGEAGQETDPPNQRDPDTMFAAQLEPPVVAGPLYDDGLDLDAIAEECDFVAESRHPDPIQLVREFLLRDAEGEFLRPESWLPTATLCPGSIPSFDAATLIEGFEIGPVALDPDTVRVPVTYERVGDMTAGLIFEYTPRIETDTVTVVRTRYGWRIDGPEWRWQVSAHVALDRFQFRPEDRELIERHVLW